MNLSHASVGHFAFGTNRTLAGDFGVSLGQIQCMNLGSKRHKIVINRVVLSSLEARMKAFGKSARDAPLSAAFIFDSNHLHRRSRRRVFSRNDPSRPDPFIPNDRESEQICTVISPKLNQAFNSDGSTDNSSDETRVVPELLEKESTFKDAVVDVVIPASTENAQKKGWLSQLPIDGLLGTSEMRELVQLVLPAFGAILSDPLMSVIDTACVGHAGSVQLAAMGPATAVFNFIFGLFTFLSIATTGAVARAKAEGDLPRLKRTVANALVIALVMGLATSLLLQVGAGPVLHSAAGGAASFVSQSEMYLRIRGLAVPAVLMCQVAQGACLGQQDAITPLVIFLVAGALNLALDMFLVLPSGMGLGLTGAAIATLVAQTLSAATFLFLLFRRNQLPKSFHLPSVEEILPFVSVSGMLLLGSVCRMGVYTLLTVSAAVQGVLVVAAHQVALQVFWFLTYFVDPLFVAATSFLARDIAPRPQRAARMAVLLLGLSTVCGCVLGLLSGAAPFVGTRLFTDDIQVIALFRQVAPMLAVGQLLASIVLVAEGVLIGVGELGYLAKMHCVNFIVLSLYLMMTVKMNWGIEGIWMGIVLNYVLRLSQHAWHVGTGKTQLPTGQTLRKAG